MRTRLLLLAPALSVTILGACGGGGGGGGGDPVLVDCDGNGVDDALQIAQGGADADADGVLDVCEAGIKRTVGLVSAVGGASSARVWWNLPDSLADLPARLGVQLGQDEALLYSGTPTEVVEASGSAEVAAAANTTWYAGLVARNANDTAWEPLGPALVLRTGEPLHVDAAATGLPADGLTPATAFRDPAAALAAAAAGPRKAVWIAQGTYAANALALPTGVHLVGGFSSAFTLGTRDWKTRPAILSAVDIAGVVDPALVVTTAQSSVEPAVVDGLRLQGLATSTAGLDASGDEVQVRSVVVTRCVRGIRLKSLPDAAPNAAVVAGSTVSRCTGNGLSLEGVLDVVVDGSQFDDNGLEGASFGPLYAPSAEIVSLVVRGCSFARNGQEGLDLQMAAPPGTLAGAPAGEFRVTMVDCDAVSNALDGLKLDVDYETFPGWTSRTIVRGVQARGNGLAGVHLDLDGDATAFLHRLACAANGTDGVQLTSEQLAPGVATLASSAMWGNGGAGARSLAGRFALKVVHCAFAGNAQGAHVAAANAGDAANSASLLNSAAEAHAAASSGTTAVSCVASVAHDVRIFERAPLEYVRATAVAGATLTLAQTPANGVGTWLELADDGDPHAVAAAFGTTLTLAEAPAAARLPASGWFFGSADARESWNAAAAGLLQGAAWTGPDGVARDCGPYGAPLAGAPGSAGALPPKLFHVARTTPAATQRPTSATQLSIGFGGGTPDAASLANGVRVVRAGAPIAAAASVVGGNLRISAPAGGWLDGDQVQLHAALRAVDGTVLAAPWVWILDVQ